MFGIIDDALCRINVFWSKLNPTRLQNKTPGNAFLSNDIQTMSEIKSEVHRYTVHTNGDQGKTAVLKHIKITVSVQCSSRF